MTMILLSMSEFYNLFSKIQRSPILFSFVFCPSMCLLATLALLSCYEDTERESRAIKCRKCQKQFGLAAERVSQFRVVIRENIWINFANESSDLQSLVSVKINSPVSSPSCSHRSSSYSSHCCCGVDLE